MEIRITSDAWWETRVGESLNQFSLRKINDYFYLKNYGQELERIVICFFCCNPEDYDHLEQKVKFNKKKKHLSIFFVLEYELFMKINNTERERIIFDIMKNDVPDIIKKKTSSQFNLNDFINDWSKVLEL